jgi:ubiquinone biosynthesis protein Coq4
MGDRLSGRPGGGEAHLVVHDFTHVLAGYDADAPGELALQAMLTSATGFDHHFSGLVASLSLYEAGKFDVLDIEQCACDFSTVDHLARADDPLVAVRADCGIPPRRD